MHGMSSVAIFGAGPIGAAIAQRLAERARVNDILFIDDNAPVAEGKALDLRQSGPIGKYDTRLSASADPLAATGAGVIVFADDTVGGAWDGERGLGLVGRLIRAGASAQFVFAAPSQTALLETAARELRLAPDRLIGTAASAAESIVISLVSVELGQTGASVCVTGRRGVCRRLVGRDDWRRVVTDRVPAHRLRDLNRSASWPPASDHRRANGTRYRGADRDQETASATILDGELACAGARRCFLSSLAAAACSAASSRHSVRRSGRRQ
jgi:hypothetical protein